MTASLAVAGPDLPDLLHAYFDHVAGLEIGESSRWARRRSARRFLDRHPDLEEWLARPTPARVSDLHREKAWPFVVWAAVAGRLGVDAELLLAKPGGVDLSVVWDRLHPGDIDRAIAVGRELGWSTNWVRQVARHALPVVCTWAGKDLGELGDEDLAGFRAEVERAAHLSESARTKARTRMFAVGQICFQLGLATRPPRRGVAEPARTPTELAALVCQPGIRREVVRYAETIGTVLRPPARTPASRRCGCSSTGWQKSTRRCAGWISWSAPLTWSRSSPGRATVPGGAPTAGAAPSRPPSSTTTSSTCACSSRTSPPGAGRAGHPSACCSSPTCRGCPSPCPGRSLLRPTPR